MDYRFLAVGDSLGALNVQNEVKYRVKIHDIYELTEVQFITWEGIRVSEENFKEQLKTLDVSDQQMFEEELQMLIEMGLIIDMNNVSMTQLLEHYSLFPKGSVLKETEVGYEITVLRKHEVIEVPMIPYLIWEQAHPYVELINVLRTSTEHIELDDEFILEQLLEWLPIFISTGLASLKQLH